MIALEGLRKNARAEILRLARLHGARNVRVFGSVARGNASDRSDLDLLVDWNPDSSLLDHVALVQDLEELLGIKVHIGNEKFLHWYARDTILHEAISL